MEETTKVLYDLLKKLDDEGRLSTTEQNILKTLSEAKLKEQNRWVQGYACAVAQFLKLEGINNSASDELFGAGIGTIQKAIDAGVDESDLEEFKKSLNRHKKSTSL